MSRGRARGRHSGSDETSETGTGPKVSLRSKYETKMKLLTYQGGS
jgi:hypothetical protein